MSRPAGAGARRASQAMTVARIREIGARAVEVAFLNLLASTTLRRDHPIYASAQLQEVARAPAVTLASVDR
jgi:hypothetical protein